nr:glutaredoxin family protein [Corynebacterium mendelii]
MIVRDGCGSCVRVERDIRGVVARAGWDFKVIDTADDPEIAGEFGDRVPVVLVDGEEFACWECDPDELAHALL